MFTKDDIKTILVGGSAIVTFEKLDGTMRTMRCTLQESVLPPLVTKDKTAPEEKPRWLNDNVLSVWDLEEQGWRSFRIDKVKSVKKEETC